MWSEECTSSRSSRCMPEELARRRCAPEVPPHMLRQAYAPYSQPSDCVGASSTSGVPFLAADGPVDAYSYAYYEPGGPSHYRGGTFCAKHTYLTRYGTEENIYEEISEVERARLRPRRHRHGSVMSLSQSRVAEEVRTVEHRHRRVLGELNLAVEAMLMPEHGNGGAERTDGELDDQLAELLDVGPTDELLSPAPFVDVDSGFSGSSSGASYRSVVGSLRRDVRPPMQKSSEMGKTSSFWKKGWARRLRLSNSNLWKQKDKDETRLPSGIWEEHSQRMLPTHLSCRTLPPPATQASSEGSWCSTSEPDVSSDDEDAHKYDRASSVSTKSSHSRRHFSKKSRSLCAKASSSPNPLDGGSRLTLDAPLPMDRPSSDSGSIFSRIFSIRRNSSHQYDIDNKSALAKDGCKLPLPHLREGDEDLCPVRERRLLPLTLPPPPCDLSAPQNKRRAIVSAIVNSENSYIATLHKLVNDYKKPLEESSPQILSFAKIEILFHKLSEILQCHTLFRVALAENIKHWDRDERIGDVFFASFSKALVLEIYSGFINNFSVAMDLAKMETKRKSALADFFKVKQISSNDRLSFFGLMVKPVQRFPQFILFLQDLLKHTPQGHHDRMSLQLALTQLESLAEMLNERKREAEQYQAFKEMLRCITGKFASRPLVDSNRYLLREDNAIQLEFNQHGLISKTKQRRLLLLNDLVVCVSVAQRISDDFRSCERFHLKWMFPVSDVQILDSLSSANLSRILTSGANNRSGSLNTKLNASFESESPQVDNIASEMSNLMHDYEVLSRIAELTGSLRGTYKDISVAAVRKTLHQIQTSIRHKDDEMAWVDSCCLQIVARIKGRDETFTFQTDNPNVRKEWITELRLAQLALDPNNSPAWEVPEQEQRPSTKMPLFVKSQMVLKSPYQTEVCCGCYFAVNTPKVGNKWQNYLWICTTDGLSSQISILQQHAQQSGVLKEANSFALIEQQVTVIEFVKSSALCVNASAGNTVWIGTNDCKIIVYAVSEPEKPEEVAYCTVEDRISQMKYHCDNVFVALHNGSILIYRRNPIDGTWIFKDPQVKTLGAHPVSSLLPINHFLYAASGKKVWVLHGASGETQKDFSIQHEHVGNVNLMAHSGVGLWISLKSSSTICLYHMETFKHLQDINIASNVMRVTSGSSNDCVNNNRSQVHVTSLLACKGLLWVGTNVGICLTIPLPRLEGVPIISGRVNISYHAHFGPITFLITLEQRKYANYSKEEAESTKIGEKTGDLDGEVGRKELKPVVLRRKRSKDNDMRLSKTLPRGLGSVISKFSNSTTSQNSADPCDVYGLYGQLMYLKDYERDEHIGERDYKPLRSSDSELAAIPSKVSTLDRRLEMKVSRPRSLDLSNWSIDSRSSCTGTTLSGSEEDIMCERGETISGGNICNITQLTDVSELEQGATIAGSSVKSNAVFRNNASDCRKTVLTAMGGRGYVNWRRPCSGDKNNLFDRNSNDAYIVIWELKL